MSAPGDHARPPRGTLALVGARGAGKTALGRRVAARAGVAFADLDDVVASVAARLVEPGGAAPADADVGAALERLGPARFRWLERLALRALLGACEPDPRGGAEALLAGWDPDPVRTLLAELPPVPSPAVVATGGGAVEDPDSRALLAGACLVVHVAAPADVLADRIRADPVRRPPLLGVDPAAEIAALLARRAPFYDEVATASFANDGDDPDAAAARLLDLWHALTAA